MRVLRPYRAYEDLRPTLALGAFQIPKIPAALSSDGALEIPPPSTPARIRLNHPIAHYAVITSKIVLAYALVGYPVI